MVSQILNSNPLSPVLPFYAGVTKLSNPSVCSILMEVTKNTLDFRSLTERMVQNPDSESSDSRRLLLALTNCIYESQNKDVCKLVNFHCIPSIPRFSVSFTGLGLDPMDCMSIGYFFANKQLDKICEVGLDRCHVGDIGVEVFMQELSRGCRAKEAKGIELYLTGKDCSHLGVKCISETMSHTPVLQGLCFVGWIRHQVDATRSLKYLVEGLCRRSAKIELLAVHKSVNYQHVYHIVLLIAFSSLQALDLTNNDIGGSSVMSLLARSLKHSRRLVVLHMNESNINDGGLQHLGSALQDHETILCLSIADNPFSSEALTFFLKSLCTVRSRLLYLRLESQRCEPLAPEHGGIVQRINMNRSPSYELMVTEYTKVSSEPVKSFFSLPKGLSTYKHSHIY